MDKSVNTNVLVEKSNENITKLREFVKKFSEYELEDVCENRFREILTDIKNMVEIEYNESDSPEKKIKAYDKLCNRLRIIFKRFKT